ncbi:MAG TPA: hypothetical protein VFE62_21705, partial [Gemmataceae bacterium]|nr:hypothetical protein [Gemmataceae bacterium]
MSTPQERPAPDNSSANSDDTYAPRPKNAGDLYPTIPSAKNNTGRLSRPALYAFLAPPQNPDEIGRLSHFRVLDRLGSGGM